MPLLPPPFQPGPQPPRRTARRDRHGRGMRGSPVLPGPLSPQGVGYPATSAQRFDDLVLAQVEPLRARWTEQLDAVEFAVEETPLLPRDWDPGEVPLATLVPGTSSSPPRIVLFRRPIEQQTGGPAETASLVLVVLVEQVAELLDRDPAEIDPRYEA
jgi:hypothetical protein